MRILWFSVTPSLYGENNTRHNGGGWISSLEHLLRNQKDVRLGVAFESRESVFREEKEGVLYYTLNPFNTFWKRIRRKFFFTYEEKLLIPSCLKVIHDFKPDVIHVFGSEWSFGLLSPLVDVPLIIHIQGSISSLYNARFPVGYNQCNFVFDSIFNPLKIIQSFKADYFFKLRSEREKRILRHCKYFMGRTDWDKAIAKLHSPTAKYHYCSEVLRPSFVNSDIIWNKKRSGTAVITTVISAPLYKGVDLVLKTASILCEFFDSSFIWKVYGIDNLSEAEKFTGIDSKNVNVFALGKVSEQQLIDKLLESDLFVHPSYIENSPNCICEAQYLGMPVIATYVGGVSSLIQHNKTGLLVASNDPYNLSYQIMRLLEDSSESMRLGSDARTVAVKRHDPVIIIQKLIETYESLSNK